MAPYRPYNADHGPPAGPPSMRRRELAVASPRPQPPPTGCSRPDGARPRPLARARARACSQGAGSASTDRLDLPLARRPPSTAGSGSTAGRQLDGHCRPAGIGSTSTSTTGPTGSPAHRSPNVLPAPAHRSPNVLPAPAHRSPNVLPAPAGSPVAASRVHRGPATGPLGRAAHSWPHSGLSHQPCRSALRSGLWLDGHLSLAPASTTGCVARARPRRSDRPGAGVDGWTDGHRAARRPRLLRPRRIDHR